MIIGGMLTRIRTLLHAIPVYTAYLWIFSAPSISTQIRMEPNSQFSSTGMLKNYVSKNSQINLGTMVFTARRVPDSLLTTMKNTLPDFAEIAPMETGKLIHILLTGQLLCPV